MKRDRHRCRHSVNRRSHRTGRQRRGRLQLFLASSVSTLFFVFLAAAVSDLRTKYQIWRPPTPFGTVSYYSAFLAVIIPLSRVAVLVVLARSYVRGAGYERGQLRRTALDPSRLAGQGGNQFVNDRANRTESFHLAHGHPHLDFESCSDDFFFPPRAPAEGTRKLPPNGLGNADLAIERWQKGDCVRAKFDLGPGPSVFRMSVRLVGQEAGGKRHDAGALLPAKQGAIALDVLPGIFGVSAPLEERADVPVPLAEISIQIDEGNAQTLREERPCRAFAGAARTNQSNHRP